MKSYITEKDREACKKVLELPQSTISSRPRVDYLREAFDDPFEYSGFIGLMMVELSNLEIGRDESISIMSDIALAGLSVSRADMMKRTA